MGEAKANKAMAVFSVVAGIASIGGVVVALVSDKNKAIIALASVIIALLFLVAIAYYGLRKILKREYPNDYLKLSLFTTFEMVDDTHCTFDNYRLIQSKRPVLTQVSWHFRWTGSIPPKCSSKLQDCDGCITKDPKSYDHVVLRLRKPLLFNETAVLHFHADMDDADHSAQPHLDFKVDSPISVIQYRVVLCVKGSDSRSNAQFMRMPINSRAPSTYEILASVAYDTLTHSYQYVLTNPEVGFFYRLEWEKQYPTI